MPDAKQTTTMAAVALAASLSGAALHAQLAPTLPTSARMEQLHVAPDGKIGLQLSYKVGGADGQHIVNCDADGSTPLLDSAPNTAFAGLCQAAAQFSSGAQATVGLMADALSQPAPVAK